MKLLACCFFLFIVSCQSFLTIAFRLNLPGFQTASFTEALTASAKNQKNQRTRHFTPAVKSIPRASVILGKKQVPILCYHQIRDWKPTDSKISRDYIVPPAAFAAQMRMLADSGYHTITPDQLYAYLISGTRLPVKPIILSFDDTDLDQYTVPIRK